MKTAKELAAIAAKALDSKKAVGLRLLKIDRVSSLADYFLICTGTSNTHVRTLCDFAEYALEEAGEKLAAIAGILCDRGNTWELLDYGCLVIHVFTEEARQFYDLERLWADAEKIDLGEIITPDGV